MMDEATKIALKNYDWLLQNRTDVGLSCLQIEVRTYRYSDGRLR
jgi:hypothetical protein